MHHLLSQASADLKDSVHADKVVRYFVRRVREFFRADQACLAIREPGDRRARILFSAPAKNRWDLDEIDGFLSRRTGEVPGEVLLRRVRRRKRSWGLLVLRRSDGQFPSGAGAILERIAAEISDRIHRIDRDRLLEVRGRIDGKLIQELPPNDLRYQILDGLHSLTRYNHSSSFFVYDDTAGMLRLAAEQISWRKAKSERIGLELAVPAAMRPLLAAGAVYGFDRSANEWREWTGHGAESLAGLLVPPDAGAGAGKGSNGEPAALLCALLGTRDGTLGVLTLAALHPHTFGEYEVEILERFVPLASIVIQRSQTTEFLQAKMLSAERKHAVADLARGVAHDINNALGAVLPLVQQMREEAWEGRVNAAELAKDLEQIEQAMQVCRRIFAGMLNFARGSARVPSEGHVARAIETTTGLLADTLERQGIGIVVQCPEDLPPVACGRNDLEQLFLNLTTNARDAMPAGGSLRITARSAVDLVEVTIADTGAGIPREILGRIEEPFFTTKANGTGLGLSMCRSILSEMRGEMRIESEPGAGTRVTVRLPVRSAVAVADA